MSNIRSNNLNTNTLFNTTLFTPDVKYRIQEWSIPGISIDHPTQNTKVGVVNFQGDILEYNPLELRLIVDEDLVVWKEIVNVLQKYQKPGTNTCEVFVGDSWVEVYTSKNNYLFKVYFKNCYIKNLSDLNYMTTDDNEVVTLGLTLVYDYYTIE